MSAIAGLMTLDARPVTRSEVSAMLHALAHRGPDGGGVWCAGGVGLGQRVRHTTPESVHETQPLVHAAAGLVLVADARIDNRAELLCTLGMKAAGDAELILRAYERWGTDCAARLAGDFAFALWDGRSRTLFCARDPMGVRPLYFHRSGRLFAFASEAKGLFAHPAVPRRLDDEQLSRFLERDADDRARTLYEGIDRLPAAHTLVVCERGVKISRYWAAENAPEVRFADGAQYAEAFRERFTEAVRARLRSVHPVGATLSGGLDSSSIACTARGLGEEDLHTFSLVFPALPEEDLRLIDERRYIDEVVRAGGIRPHMVRGDALSPLADVQRMLWHLDEPFFTPNLYLHWGMYGAARSAGVRVLLDGFDGDTTVSHGLGRLDSLLRAGDWNTFEAELRAFARRREIDPAQVLRYYGLPYLEELARRGEWLAWRRAAGELRRRFGARRLAADHGLRPAVPAPLKALWRAARGRSAAPESLLRPERARGLARSTAATPCGERESHLAGLAQPLYQLTLEIADKCAAAFGIEARYPFFDRRLIELCVGIPDEHKLADGWTRLTFRRAMEGVLPPEIQWRTGKGNLTANFQRRLRAADGAALAAVSRERLAPYVAPSRLDEVSRRYFARPDSGHADADSHLLFQAAVLDRWLADQTESPGAARISAAA